MTATGKIRAAKVSFDRPYSDGYGSGQLAGNSWSWERYYVGWLEKSGYDVAYSTNLDPHPRVDFHNCTAVMSLVMCTKYDVFGLPDTQSPDARENR